MYSGAMMPSAAAADPFFRGASSAARPLSSFLRSLFSIVNDPATDDVVSWSAEGTSFVIHSVERFSEEVLPQYYKHSNFSSFSRQLNFYSFKKVMEEDEDHYNGSAGGSGSHGGAGHGAGAKHSATFEYRHKYFLRGRPDLLIRVVRKTNASAIKELAAEEKADKARRKRQEEGVAPAGHAAASHHHHHSHSHGGGIVPPLPGGSAAAGLPVPGALALAGGMPMELLMEGGEGAAGSGGGGFEPLGAIYGHSGGPAAAPAQDAMLPMHGGRGGPGAMHHSYHAPQQQQMAYQTAGAGGRSSALSHPADDAGVAPAAGAHRQSSSSGGASSGQDPVTALLVSLGLVEGGSSGSAGSVHPSAGNAPFKTVSALTTTLTRPVSSTGTLALGPGGVFLPGSSGHLQPYAAYGGAARYGGAAPQQQQQRPPAGTFQPLTAAGAAGQLARVISTSAGTGPAPPPATPLLLSLDGEDDEEDSGLDIKGRGQDGMNATAAADGSGSSGEHQVFVGEGPAALAAHLAQAAAAAGLLPAAAAEAGSSTAAAPAGSAGLQGLLTALTTPTPDGSVDWAAGIPPSASAEKREQLAALRQMVVALSGSLTGTQSSLMSLVQGGATLLPMLQANPALAAGAITDAQTPADAEGPHTGTSAPGASSLDVTALGSPVGGAGSLPVPERAGPSPAAAAAAAAAGFMPPVPPAAVMQPALNAALGAAANAAADALSAAVCKPAPASDGEGDIDASSSKLALQLQQRRSRMVDPQLILEAVAAAPQTLELAGLLRTLTADGIRDLSSSKALASIPAAGEGEGDASGACEAGGEDGKAAAPQSKRVPQLLRQLLQRLVALPAATASGGEEGSEGGSAPAALRLTDLSPQQLEALQKLVLAAAAAAASQSVLPSGALSAVHRAPTALQQQQQQQQQAHPMFAGRPPLPHPAAYGGRGGHLMRPGPHGMMPLQPHGQPGGGPFPVSYAPLGNGGVLDLTPGPPSTAHLYVTSPPFRNNPAAPHLQKGKGQQQPAQGGPAATRGGRHSGRGSAAGGEDRERDRSRERERDRSDGDSSEREGGSSYYDASYRSGRNSSHGHRAGGASFTKGGAAVAGPRYRGNRERGDSDLSAYGGSTGEGSPGSGGHRSSSAVELLHGEGGDGPVAVVGRGGIHRHYREQQGVTVVSRNGQSAAAAGSGVSGWIASRRQQRGSASSASSCSSNASSNTLASAYSGINAPPSPGLLSLGLGFQLGLGLGDAEGEEADTCEGDEEAAGQNDFSQGSVGGAGRGRLASAASSDTYNYFHGLPLPPSTATVGGSDDAASAAGSEGAMNNSLEYGREGAGDDADAEGASTTRLGRRSRASRAAEAARASIASNPYSRPYGAAAADYEGEEGEGDDEDEGDAEDEEAAAAVAGQRSRRGGGIASRGRIARSGKGKGPLSGPNTRAHRALLPLPPAVGGWPGAGEGAGSGSAGSSMLSPGAAGLGIGNAEGGIDSGLLARRQVKRPRKLQVGEGEGGEGEHAGAPQAAGPLLAPAAVNPAASALSARGGQHAQAQAAGLAAVGGSLFSPCGGYPMPTPQHAGLAGLPSTTAAASRVGSAAAAGLQAPHTSAGGSPPAPESPIFTPHASSGSAGRQAAAYTNVSSRVVGVAGGLPVDAGSATRTGTGALTFPASTMARLSGLSLASPQPVQNASHGGAGAAAAAARALADATAREDASGAAAGAEGASRLVHPPLPPLDTANALAGGAAALATSRAGGSGLGLLTMLHAQYRQAPAAGAAPAATHAGAASHSGGVPGAAPAFMSGLPGYLFAPTPAHGVPRSTGLPGMGGLPSTRAGGVAASGSSSALSSAGSTSAASSASSGGALGASFGGLGLSLMSPAGGSSSGGGGGGGFQSGYGLLSSMAAGGSGGGVWGSNPLSMFSSTHLMQHQQQLQRQMQGQVQRPGAGGGAGDASVSRMNAMDVSAFLSSGAFSTRHMAGAGGLPSTTAAGLREAAAGSWIASGSGFAPPSPPASAAGISAFRAVAAAAAPAALVPAPVASQAPAAPPAMAAAATSAPASAAFTSPLAATLGVQLTVAPAVAAQSAPGAVSTAAPGGKLLSPSLFHLSSALSPALFSPGLAHTCLSATAAAAVNRSKARMASVAGGAAAGAASGATGPAGGEGVTPSGHRAMQSAARRNMRHSHQGAAAGEDDGAESSTSASSSEGTRR